MNDKYLKINKALILFISLELMLSLFACKEHAKGPSAPEEAEPIPVEAVKADSEDAVPQIADDLSPEKAAEPAPAASPAPGALPANFQTGLADCQKLKRYFDLQLASCTEIQLAEFPCDLAMLTAVGSPVLTAEQKSLLKDYVEKNLQDFTLYACTLDESLPNLHFYKVEADRIRANNVKISKGS
ncbi:MAG: hypothetical protein NTX25_22075 [Proteobacteria bacterium]|nr:hypothetical protein [Pseudomonadota bacterium]